MAPLIVGGTWKFFDGILFFLTLFDIFGSQVFDRTLTKLTAWVKLKVGIISELFI